MSQLPLYQIILPHHTNNLISSSIVSNQNILSIFLTFVNASDFSSNVYNYNNLFQALMVDVGAANSGLEHLYK